MKKLAKKSAKKTANRAAVKSNPYKKGQTVKYDGKKFEVRRAYVYKGLPLCIIANDKGRHMVSANSLTK